MELSNEQELLISVCIYFIGVLIVAVAFYFQDNFKIYTSLMLLTNYIFIRGLTTYE